MRTQILCASIAATAAMRPFAALPSHSRRRTVARRLQLGSTSESARAAQAAAVLAEDERLQAEQRWLEAHHLQRQRETEARLLEFSQTLLCPHHAV